MNPRLIPGPLLLALLFSVGNGCGRVESPPEPVDSRLTTVRLESVGAATGSKPDAPERLDSPRRGGELRIPLSGVAVLDPAVATGLSESLPIHQIFQGLVRFDPRLRVVPDLARSWSLSSDRLSYTFELHPEARFHHGRLVDSDDVAYSLRRLLDPDLGSVMRPYLAEVLADGDAAITCPDERRVVIRLKRPDQVFISFLAMPAAKIVPRDRAGAVEFRNEPIGSGPFRFVEWRREELVLEAARKEDTGPPHVDRIVFLDLGGEFEVREFHEGSFHYFVNAPIDVREISSLDSFVPRNVSTLSVYFLGMNSDLPPLDDIRVRSAIAMAIDRGKLEADTAGGALAARSILPPGIQGYNPAFDPFPFDPQRARALLREAGYGPGLQELPELEILVGRVPGFELVKERLTRDLGNVGIPVQMRFARSYKRFLESLSETSLALVGWGADYPDPDCFFSNLFRTGAPNNFTGYSNTRLDEIIEEARHGSVSRLDRALLYRKAEELLFEDCPLAPLFHDASIHFVRKDVRHLDINALGIYYTRLDQVWLER